MHVYKIKILAILIRSSFCPIFGIGFIFLIIVLFLSSFWNWFLKTFYNSLFKKLETNKWKHLLINKKRINQGKKTNFTKTPPNPFKINENPSMTDIHLMIKNVTKTIKQKMHQQKRKVMEEKETEKSNNEQ